MILSFSKVRTGFAAIVLTSVPAFAVWSLIPGTAMPGTELTRGDDPVRNGLRIIDTSLPTPRLHAEPAAAPEETLKDWEFTEKGKPTPYG